MATKRKTAKTAKSRARSRKPSAAKTATRAPRVQLSKEDAAREAARSRLMKSGQLASPQRSLSPRVD